MKQLIKGDNSDVTAEQRFIAGSIAGLSAQTTIYPLEVGETSLPITAALDMSIFLSSLLVEQLWELSRKNKRTEPKTITISAL